MDEYIRGITMRCKICKQDIDQGNIYCYTRDGHICVWCVQLYNWFVPEFALGKVGGRVPMLEQTQPQPEQEDGEQLLLSLYLG
jgi:hypothetical protein